MVTTFHSRAVRKELFPVFSTLRMRTAYSPLAHLVRIPNGCADLIWCDGTIDVHGPRLTRAATTRACTTALVCFRFQPGAAARWLGTGASSIVDVELPLDAFGKRRADDLARSVGSAVDAPTVAARLEAALVATLSDATVLDRPCIGKVLELLEREHSNGAFLNALRRAYNLSERSVRRETIRIFGYGPKTLERIFRVQRFLALARSPSPANLAWLANAGGFSDQAHMTREVRALTGFTPREAVRFVQDTGAKLA